MQGNNNNFDQSLAQTQGEIQKELHELQLKKTERDNTKREEADCTREIATLEEKIKTIRLNKQNDIKKDNLLDLEIRKLEEHIRSLREELIRAQNETTKKMQHAGFKDLH